MTVNEFIAQRETFLAGETARILGAGLTLNANEELINTVLMDAKNREFDLALASLDFTPAVHFFQSKPSMLQSEVFQFIREMPKGYHYFLNSSSFFLKLNESNSNLGGVLHIHDIAVTPVSNFFIILITKDIFQNKILN